MQIKQITIGDLQQHIQEMEKQIIQTKAVINSLMVMNGEAPLYTDSDLIAGQSAGPRALKKDQFYGKTIHSAMREYLESRKAADQGPATLNEIYAALVEGGLSFETENEDNRKANMRFLLRKNSSIFHRLPDKVHFGLTEWYPNIKRDDDRNAEKKTSKKNRRQKPKPKKTEAAETKGEDKADHVSSPKEQTSAAGKALTQEQAVGAAIDAMGGEFKRQDIVDWIDKNHPSVQASKKRDSIFAMIGKMKDRLITVKEAKGAEPAIYRSMKK